MRCRILAAEVRAEPCLSFMTRGTRSPYSASSRHIVSRTDMIAGPRNRPIEPKVSSPPKMPSKIHRKGKRVELPIRIGRTK